MLEVSNSFKQKMKTYGKRLNILLEFGSTILNKPYVKKFEQSYYGDILTSIMRTITLEVAKYETIDPANILKVADVNENTVKQNDITRVKYLATDLNRINSVEDVDEMNVGNLNSSKVRFFIDREKKEDISKAKTIKIKLGVKVLEDEEYEYVDYGEFEVYSIEDKVESDSVKLVLYDYMIDTHIPYDLSLAFPMNVGDFLQAICNRFGFNLLTNTFANSDEIITEDKYTGLDYTFRDILDEIAQVSGGFIKMFNKNLSVCYPTDTGEIVDENDLEKLHIGEYVGQYNSVVLGRSPQEDNIYYPTNIEHSQRVSVRIDNNQIMDKNREDYIQGIYGQVNGFEYYSFELNSFGFGYFEFGDIVTLKDLEGISYKSIFMNVVQTIESGIKEKIYTDKTKYSETKYEYATGIEKRVRNTEIITNKQSNQITAIISQQQGDSIRINSLEMDLESTELELRNVENETSEQVENLRQDITGLTNTLTNSGGDNLFLYDKENYDGNIDEYNDTEIINNSVSGLGYKLRIGTATQIVHVKNGIYTVSFLYKKLTQLAICSVKINDVEYTLNEMNFTEFSKTIEVTSNIIKVQFVTDTDNSCYIVDLMGNLGTTKITWTQNANETITDTVKIGKGIQVNSNVKNTFTRIDADGNRTYNKSTNQVVAELTDKGLEAEEVVSRGKAQLAGLLVQEINSQVWLSSLL